jgi:hypothetical protein
MYTCAPLGSGARMALDRDEDGFLDGDRRSRRLESGRRRQHRSPSPAADLSERVRL